MRETMRLLIAMTIAFAAYACSFAPRHVRPDLPTAPIYPESYAGDTTSGRKPPALAWHDFFADPRLEALVQRALDNNRDLEIAVAQVDEARARYRIQRADRLPTLGVSAAAARNHAGPQALASNGGVNAPANTAITYERYSLGASVAAFELDFWGRVRNLSNAARAEYLATAAAARSFRLSLIREVANAYFTSLEARERLQLATATVQSRRDGLRIAKRRLDAGVTSALDYSQAETLLTQAEIELAALQLSLAQSDNLLTSLIGAPIDDLPSAMPLADQAHLETLAAGLPSELLTARPDIIAAEERLRAARANIGAARAAFLPSITLTGTYGYASNELDDLVGKDWLTWSYGPSISLPLFDYGRRRANLDVAKAREIQAVANYERTIQEGFREVSDALAGRKFLAEQVDAQQRATLAQRRLAELARTRYREGVVGYLEVLDAERNLFAAEQALLQVRRAEVSNLVSLYVALGGGLF
jgi:multidrug efflux system outer membrane protein